MYTVYECVVTIKTMICWVKELLGQIIFGIMIHKSQTRPWMSCKCHWCDYLSIIPKYLTFLVALHEPDIILQHRCSRHPLSLSYKIKLHKITVKSVTDTYWDVSRAAVGSLQSWDEACVCVYKVCVVYLTSSPRQMAQWVYRVIIIKMKHPVGKPETRMLLHQFLICLQQTLRDWPLFVFSFCSGYQMKRGCCNGTKTKVEWKRGQAEGNQIRRNKTSS